MCGVRTRKTLPGCNELHYVVNSKNLEQEFIMPRVSFLMWCVGLAPLFGITACYTTSLDFATIRREVKFIPISGLQGANVLKEVDAKVCPWWKACYEAGDHNTTDPTLIGMLDNLKIEGRSAESPLRIPALDRYHERGTVVMGKVESGRVARGRAGV